MKREFFLNLLIVMSIYGLLQVLLDHDRKSVVQSVRVSAPIVGIESLTPGETYAFRIIPIFPSDAPAGRALNLPPTNVRISNVGRNSFRVSWDVTEKAAVSESKLR